MGAKRAILHSVLYVNKLLRIKERKLNLSFFANLHALPIFQFALPLLR